MIVGMPKTGPILLPLKFVDSPVFESIVILAEVNSAANMQQEAQARIAAGHAIESLGTNLRNRRRELGLTLQEVAEGAGLTAGFISQLERNLTGPSISSLAAIARVLQSDLADFFAQPEGRSLTTEAQRRRQYALDETATQYERLSADFEGHVINGVIMHEQPGHRSEPIHHEGEELFYVLKGSITVELDGKAIVLKAGDSIHFSSEQCHSTWNHTSDVASVLVVVTMDIFGGGKTDDRRRG